MDKLIKKAKALWIPAHKWRKKETIEKAIAKKKWEVVEEKSIAGKVEPVVTAPSALEQAMALLINSNVETNKKLDVLISKLDKPDKNLEFDAEKQQIKYKTKYYAIQVEWMDSQTWRPLIWKTKSRNYKTFKEADIRGVKNFWKWWYIVWQVKEPVSMS